MNPRYMPWNGLLYLCLLAYLSAFGVSVSSESKNNTRLVIVYISNHNNNTNQTQIFENAFDTEFKTAFLNVSFQTISPQNSAIHNMTLWCTVPPNNTTYLASFYFTFSQLQLQPINELNKLINSMYNESYQFSSKMIQYINKTKNNSSLLITNRFTLNFLLISTENSTFPLNDTDCNAYWLRLWNVNNNNKTYSNYSTTANVYSSSSTTSDSDSNNESQFVSLIGKYWEAFAIWGAIWFIVGAIVCVIISCFVKCIVERKKQRELRALQEKNQRKEIERKQKNEAKERELRENKQKKQKAKRQKLKKKQKRHRKTQSLMVNSTTKSSIDVERSQSSKSKRNHKLNKLPSKTEFSRSSSQQIELTNVNKAIKERNNKNKNKSKNNKLKSYTPRKKGGYSGLSTNDDDDDDGIYYSNNGDDDDCKLPQTHSVPAIGNSPMEIKENHRKESSSGSGKEQQVVRVNVVHYYQNVGSNPSNPSVNGMQSPIVQGDIEEEKFPDLPPQKNEYHNHNNSNFKNGTNPMCQPFSQISQKEGISNDLNTNNTTEPAYSSHLNAPRDEAAMSDSERMYVKYPGQTTNGHV